MSYISVGNNYPYVCVTGPVADQTIVLSFNNARDFIFKTVLEGGLNNFNTTTGIFTATIKGLYKFEIIFNCMNNTGTNDDTGELGYEIKKNNVTTVRFIRENPEARSTTSVEYTMGFQTIVSLNVNDTVNLWLNGFTDAQKYLANTCYFTAYLIAAFS